LAPGQERSSPEAATRFRQWPARQEIDQRRNSPADLHLKNQRPMNLYLLRHGLAVEAGTSDYSKDSERPLTAKGERKLWKIAEAMEDMELSFDWVLSSPYVRARQTAQIVAEALSLRKKLEITETLTPAGSTKKLIESINQKQPLPKDILLVGHEPYLSELISLLVSGNNELAISMKKGGLCNLAIEALEYGRCARLEFLLTPKQMCLMG
jgi:phosphohistidine phosphatase